MHGKVRFSQHVLQSPCYSLPIFLSTDLICGDEVKKKLQEAALAGQNHLTACWVPNISLSFDILSGAIPLAERDVQICLSLRGSKGNLRLYQFTQWIWYWSYGVALCSRALISWETRLHIIQVPTQYFCCAVFRTHKIHVLHAWTPVSSDTV